MNDKLQVPMSLEDYAALEEHLLEVVTLLGRQERVGLGYWDHW